MSCGDERDGVIDTPVEHVVFRTLEFEELFIYAAYLLPSIPCVREREMYQNAVVSFYPYHDS